MSSKSSRADFIVEKEEYSPKDFFDQFSHQLPKLVKVTKGYYGEEQIKTFEIGQVLFIRKPGSQERVVANVLQGPRAVIHKILSIPLDYNAKFKLVSSEQRSCKLRQVLSKSSLPMDVIFIPEMTSNHLTSRLINNEDSLVLRLTHRYQETFLLGHTLNQDKVTSIIQQLPIFLTDLRVSLVVGRMGYDTPEWMKYLHALNEICTHQIKCDNYIGNPDIALYDRDGNDFDAKVQIPRVYCTIQDCLSDTNMYQTLSAPRTKTISEENFNTYDVIPNHSKENASSITKVSSITKSKPFVPPKPQKKTEIKQIAKWSVTCFKTPPLRRSKSSSATQEGFKGQTTLLRLSKEYEDISLVSRENSDSSCRTLEKQSLSCKTESAEEMTPNLPPRKTDPRGKGGGGKPTSTIITGRIEEMTMQDVGIALKKLRLEKYIPVFKQQWIDGAILRGLDADILHLECGMNRIEAIRLMTFVQKGHIPE
uniref:Uncharacterized protein LOC111105755 isoform X1 n=1 Tax=Crassostrea virginica TaxID=6565 RepID=A0A8B8AXA4_CRAVI|nr:uncharacterized protein LOC111105755 isoform X1 [Crassostrea virginica]